MKQALFLFVLFGFGSAFAADAADLLRAASKTREEAEAALAVSRSAIAKDREALLTQIQTLQLQSNEERQAGEALAELIFEFIPAARVSLVRPNDSAPLQVSPVTLLRGILRRDLWLWAAQHTVLRYRDTDRH